MRPTISICWSTACCCWTKSTCAPRPTRPPPRTRASAMAAVPATGIAAPAAIRNAGSTCATCWATRTASPILAKRGPFGSKFKFRADGPSVDSGCSTAAGDECNEDDIKIKSIVWEIRRIPQVPEPAMAALFGLALFGTALAAGRRRR
ncbi:MAG: PEP-CTERM sorting domain-containing protein [Alphaproteobacteria bacterium]|nr:PEP-CTERM sorting domain-containing protein [Alphaproteobacteria bacterium]